ncbi:MAG: hypothetical protein LBS86_04675 [Treponema sp.]|nr:hypothetical protein [Treponema sp.]
MGRSLSEAEGYRSEAETRSLPFGKLRNRRSKGHTVKQVASTSSATEYSEADHVCSEVKHGRCEAKTRLFRHKTLLL